MNVWVVRADGGSRADAFRDGGYVAISFSIFEPYPVGQGEEAYRDVFRKYNPSKPKPAVTLQARQISQFCEDMQPGDWVITPSKNSDVLYYGQLLDQPYYFEPDPTNTCPYRHKRRVDWNKNVIVRTSFSASFQKTLYSRLTVFNVPEASEFLTAIA